MGQPDLTGEPAVVGSSRHAAHPAADGQIRGLGLGRAETDTRQDVLAEEHAFIRPA
jgi:hypothetical protein